MQQEPERAGDRANANDGTIMKAKKKNSDKSHHHQKLSGIHIICDQEIKWEEKVNFEHNL